MHEEFAEVLLTTRGIDPKTMMSDTVTASPLTETLTEVRYGGYFVMPTQEYQEMLNRWADERAS